MNGQELAERIERLCADSEGFLSLEPAFVARDWIPAGRRLALPEGLDYDLEGRGAICERWLASTTKADNAVGPDDEGLSHLVDPDGVDVTLRDAVEAAPAAIMGAGYARGHTDLGRLAKVFDYGTRVPMHIHPPADQAALVGRRSKDEAYYFLGGAPPGPHPESFIGLHPFVAEPAGQERLLDRLVRWEDDRVLALSKAYLEIHEEGFFVPSGVLHAAGTALTFELQEASDTLAMFQAVNAGQSIDKELLFKDVSAEDRARLGERALLRWVDWTANTDPDLYSTYHLAARPRATGPGWVADWILYGSPKFVGTRLRVDPGATAVWREPGVYSVFAWSGEGRLGARDVVAGQPGRDEVLVCHDAAVVPHEIVNTGPDVLELILYFGPDIHPGVPASDD